MHITGPAQSISQWLQWDGDLGMLRLDASALHYFAQSGCGSSSKDYLHGSNPALISYVQGLTLVTCIHWELILRMQRSGSRSPPRIPPDDPFAPMLCSSVSLDGDMMHQLHRDFVRGLENEFRDMVLMIHFRVLNGVIRALSSGLTERVRKLSKVASYLRLGSYSMSAFLGFSAIWPFWQPSRLLFSVIGLLFGYLIPRIVRWLVGRILDWKLGPALREWRSKAHIR